MGIIIGRFRKKKNTYDILEKLENEITSIEEFGRSTEQFRKKVIAKFIQAAILIYIILAVILYKYHHTMSSNAKLMCFIILIIALPLVIWFTRKFLAWYYSKKLQRNEKKLVQLKEEKKKILDNVMETETYKVAKNILDKFGNERKQIALPESALRENMMVRSNQPGLRQRLNVAPTSKRLSFGTPKDVVGDRRNIPSPTMGQTPFLQSLPVRNTVSASTRLGAIMAATPQGAGIPLPLPRSILPSNRSVLDKMVDFLVGDGPSNRYALICNKCSCHNGMALKEEFEYLSFKCCYCSHFNPAKKKKPTGPKFETPHTLKITALEDTSDSDKDTVDSEPEVPNVQHTGRRSSSEPDLPRAQIVEAENSSPENGRNSDLEKNSDFDKLSDFDYKEGEEVPKFPVDSGISPEMTDSFNPFGPESAENPYFIPETEEHPTFLPATEPNPNFVQETGEHESTDQLHALPESADSPSEDKSKEIEN